MTYHQKIGFGVFFLIGLLLVGFGYFLLKNNQTKASEVAERGEIAWQVSMQDDLNGDGKKETVFITSYADGDKKSAYISTKENFWQIREKVLTGFEEDLAFCSRKVIEVAGEKAICVFGEVGVHSQNIQIVRWKDFSPVYFYDKANQRQKNMSSDVPNFDFGYSAGEKLKIFFDNRDYDKDPLVDIIRTSYYLVNNSFRYESIEHHSSEGLIK